MGIVRAGFVSIVTCAALLVAPMVGAAPHADLSESAPEAADVVRSLPGAEQALLRLSDLITELESLEPASSAEIPEELTEDIAAAIAELREVVSDGALLDLDTREIYSFLLVVDQLVYEPLVAVHADAEWEYCGPDSASCSGALVLNELDLLGDALAPAFWRVQKEYEHRRQTDEKGSSFPEGAQPATRDLYNSQTFGRWVDELTDTFGGMMTPKPLPEIIY